MKLATILAVVALLVALSAAKESAGLHIAVSQEDVAISQQDIENYGLPPKIYTYDFRECFFCNYTCAVQNSFPAQQAQRVACLNNCANQDFCKNWIKPQWKAPVAPQATLWKLVTVPTDLATKLQLVREAQIAGNTIYKPVYIPYPWMCASPVEYIEPEYKPEPVPVVLYVTPTYHVVSSIENPIRTLQLYLPPNVINTVGLAPYSEKVYVYGLVQPKQ